MQQTDLRLRCRSFAAQVVRSAASIGANIGEARGSGTRIEFAIFFRIALKSANETKYWLELIQDVGLTQSARVQPIPDEARQIANMLGAAVIRLNAKSGKL
jgi:four helix bundle protein